ncbi:hypothetical protein TNIN_444751 [Trichonephila inaurata madagascariensis]|uniref:Uncharacterized protein n=1 Tax=Trichonephila inaurata madagascariensis TaxID=2747483 RepID=A0A8X7CM11_9ARAC|nr:hypothetical protein TNIN_444751 [Trichonephila inaurata madagascariensis]
MEMPSWRQLCRMEMPSWKQLCRMEIVGAALPMEMPSKACRMEMRGKQLCRMDMPSWKRLYRMDILFKNQWNCLGEVNGGLNYILEINKEKMFTMPIRQPSKTKIQMKAKERETTGVGIPEDFMMSAF